MLMVAGVAHAVTTKTWEVATFKDFDEGDGDGVQISADGQVAAGRDTKRVAVSADAVWTMARAADGTIYAGTLDKGEIVAISGGKARVVASLKETPWIGALAVADRKIYAGTVGTGSVYAIDASSGKSELVVKLAGAEHVWALVLDPSGKTLYAATGSSGKLFAIDLGSKKARLLWDSDEAHLLSMLRAPDGALWVGTSDEAILYRVDPKTGAARAAADFAGTEVKALAWQDGAVIAAVNDFEKKSGTAPATKGKTTKPSGTAIKPPEAGEPGAETDVGSPRPGERKGKGALFRVDAAGRVEQLHALADGYFQSLAESGGTVYAGAGTGGRIYALTASGEVETAFDVEERQVNALVGWKDGLAFATGDGAAVYTAAGPPTSGTYTSKVFDAGGPAHWGKLRWGGAGPLLESRSGNTAKPDSGWSAWHKLGASAASGPDGHAAQVGSPPGRYLQFRARFSSAGSLERVSIYYLPENLRTRITEVTFDPGAARPRLTLDDGPSKIRSPVVKIKWKVENPDGDTIRYTIAVRAEGDAVWRPLPMGDAPYTKVEYDWNTEGLPDGLYRAQVRASDAGSNPTAVALSGEKISQPFLIDNGKPSISRLSVSYPKVSCQASDGLSRIYAVAYSVDGGDWIMAYPTDGIFDDLSEAFAFELGKDLRAGLHTLQVRVADDSDNLGSSQVTFRVGH
jgi:hypothetical protein